MAQRITYPILASGQRSISVDGDPRLGTVIHNRGQISISEDDYPPIWIGIQPDGDDAVHDIISSQPTGGNRAIHSSKMLDWKSAFLPYRSKLGSCRIDGRNGGLR